MPQQVAPVRARPQVVVLGAGAAGIYIARALRPHAAVTVVDRKDFYEITWATVRAHTTPDIADRILIPYEDISGFPSFIQAGVKAIHPDHVELDRATTLQLDQTLPRHTVQPESSRLPYDYLVICTGTSYSTPFARPGHVTTLQERKQGFQEGSRTLLNSGSVLVVGGGPAGVELAADIAKDRPGKLITLAHAGHALLCPTTPPAASRHCLEWLTQHGVKVLLNARVHQSADGNMATEAGQDLPADLVFFCTGGQPNSDFMRPNLGACLDRDRYAKLRPMVPILAHYHQVVTCVLPDQDLSGLSSALKMLAIALILGYRKQVDAHLRLEGHAPGNIFAAGDVTNLPGVKLGFLSTKQAHVVVANIRALLRHKGQPDPAMKLPKVWQPKRSPNVMFIALGRKHGVCHIGSLVSKHLLPRLKSKDLFIGSTRRSIGAKDRRPASQGSAGGKPAGPPGELETQSI